MNIVIAKTSASKADIIKTIGAALHFPDYAREDNWDSFEECLADSLESAPEHVIIHIRAVPTEGSAAATLIGILTDLRASHENLAFLVGDRPNEPSTSGDALERKQA